MFESIFEDIKYTFRTGNMVTRLIIINVAAFVVTALIQAFAPTFYQSILPYIALPGRPILILFRPWTLITHMFIHAGLWHLIWNMLVLYWFGIITGDLLGDKKIVPIYIIGGLVGALAYILSFQFLSSIGSIAMGASAAIMAIVFAAVATSPDYNMRLILLGNVKIKFIGLAILFFDIIGTRSDYNSGGHIAHLGGALFGLYFVYLLRSGIDLSAYYHRVGEVLSFNSDSKTTRKSKLKVAHRASTTQAKSIHQRSGITSSPSRVDEILEKIKQKGYDSLSAEEKEVLYQASKN